MIGSPLTTAVVVVFGVCGWAWLALLARVWSNWS